MDGLSRFDIITCKCSQKLTSNRKSQKTTGEPYPASSTSPPLSITMIQRNPAQRFTTRSFSACSEPPRRPRHLPVAGSHSRSTPTLTGADRVHSPCSKQQLVSKPHSTTTTSTTSRSRAGSGWRVSPAETDPPPTPPHRAWPVALPAPPRARSTPTLPSRPSARCRRR